jgi:uncharacterized protein
MTCAEPQVRGLLSSGHVQSILGGLPPRSRPVRQRAAALLEASHELLLDCGAGVRLQAFHTPARAHRLQLAVLLHGWEGDAASSHVLSLASLLWQHDFDVVRLNLRDHGATHHLNRELFHSCRLSDVTGAVRALSQQLPHQRLYLAGFSLGGNFMLRVAAASEVPTTLATAVAISPVLDPAVTLAALERGLPLYRRYFVRRWSRSLRRKQRAWPETHDFEALLRTADLRAMTAGLVERCTDFPDLEAYLRGYAITDGRLETLPVPCALLLAEDDPLVPAADLARLGAAPGLRIVRTRRGGHCSFIERLDAPSFADRFVLESFAAVAGAAATDADRAVATNPAHAPRAPAPRWHPTPAGREAQRDPSAP